jgi:hypothetical protein
MKAGDIITVGVGVGVLYALYKVFGKGGPASNATNAVAGAIAAPITAALNWYYGSVDIVPSGNVILPNGTKVPSSKIALTWDDANNVASFVYQGYGYIIRPNPNGGPAYDQNGDYHAE